jgi:hypothetical protein
MKSDSTIEILAIGDDLNSTFNKNNLNNLFQFINREFETNLKYKNGLNQIKFIKEDITPTTTIAADDDSLLNLKINTKYYDLNGRVKLIDINNNDFQIDSIECLIIVLTSTLQIDQNLNDKIEKVLAQNGDCLKLIIHYQKDQKDQKDQKLDSIQTNKIRDKFEDFVEIFLFNKNDQNDNESEDDDDFDSLDELFNTLFVHNWSNIQLKETNKPQKTEKDHKDQKEKVEEEEEGEDNFDFEHLLMNLQDIRSKGETMTFEERKKYAEDVVKKFWTSIGGEEDEIDGIESD